jgi:hypothetical protein
VIAFRNDSFDNISWGFLRAFATATAFAPVSSAIRSRAEDTAGADAPLRGIIPRAAVTHAIVLAVPITPQVPIYRGSICQSFVALLSNPEKLVWQHTVGASSSLIAEISSTSISPARNEAQLLRQSVHAPIL